MSKRNHQKAPDSAFRFKLSRPEFKQTTVEGEKSQRKFAGVAYSGNPLRHPYWGTVIFDLATTEAPDPTPALIEHDRGQRAGYATLSIGDGITIEDGTLLDNQHGADVANESDQGFPWQMSVHIEPGSVEELKAGATAVINGHTVHGPANIFRNNLIREISFTPTGVDSSTVAAAMSTGAKQTDHTEETMDLEELKNQVTELKASLESKQSELEAAQNEAEAAKAELEKHRQEQRMSAVKELFSATGKEFTEEAAKPYLEMTDEMFSAVANDIKAAKPELPESLFSAQAEDGETHSAGGADMLINA